MRQTRTTALSRHRAPSFALVAGLELLQLRKLPSFARAVFLELVALAAPDGSVWTSYAQLAALLDFDQAPGAHTEPRPTQRRLRTALEALADVDLIRLDRRRNRSAKALFFQLSPRQGIASPANRSDTRSDRRRPAGKQAPARVLPLPTPEERQTERQGIQERETPPSPPRSTATKAEALEQLRQLQERMAERAAQAHQVRPPRGAK